MLWGVTNNDMTLSSAPDLALARKRLVSSRIRQTDGTVAIAPVEDPPNQIPYLRTFLNHCCTFAHELLVDHQPHSSRLRGIHSWNIAPDITLDVDSINQNRVGMRYYRAGSVTSTTR